MFADQGTCASASVGATTQSAAMPVEPDDCLAAPDGNSYRFYLPVSLPAKISSAERVRVFVGPVALLGALLLLV